MKTPVTHIIILLIFSFKIAAQQPCSSGFITNGVDDFIEIPNSTYINTNNTAVSDRTIEMWFKTSDITTKQVLYEEGGGVNAFIVYIEGGRVYSGQYINNGGVNERLYFRSGSGDISTDTWYHIAYTLSSGNTAKWYLNGVEQDSQTAFAVKKHTGDVNFTRSGGNIKYPSSLVSNWNASSVGGSTGENYTNTLTGNVNSNFNFSGNTTLFRIWSVARTQSEIDTNKSTYLTSGTGLVAYQNGDEVNYRGNSDSGPTSNITSNNSGVTYTWTGGTSNVFTNDLNWSGTSPDVSKTQTVVINNASNDPSITSEVKIGKLTVDSGAEIIVQNGATLHIYYELTNNGTITIENGGSLIFHSCNSSIAGSGTFNVKRNSPSYSNAKFYSYWSSPIVEADSDPSVIFSANPIIYYFNASITNADWAVNSGADFKPGVGYAIRHESSGSYTATFTGKINEGEISVPVYYNTNLASTDPGNVWNTQGDNFVGNPYPSAIDWDLVVADDDNSELEGTIYFWDQTVSLVGDNDVNDYKQYNMTGGSTPGVTGKIGSGQGFFVRTTTAGAISFKTVHQIAGTNTQFYKGRSSVVSDKKKGRSWLKLKRGNKTNTILVGFLKGATNRYDRLYDSPYDITQTSLGFYSLTRENKKASIQGAPKLRKKKKVVKLGFVVDEIGDYSIQLQEEHINNEYYIYLRDTEKKVTVDLRKKGYDFSIDSIGENNTRFKLIYTKKKRNSALSKSNEKVVLDENALDLLVYVDEAKELITEYDYDSDNVKEVSLYNINGSKVASFLGSDSKSVSSLKTGIYIANVKLLTGKVLTKKISITNN
jgi:hypothetical protein